MRNKVQSRLRSIQDAWPSAKTDEVQGYDDRYNTKWLYNALTTIYEPKLSGSSPLLSVDATTLLTNKKQALER